MERNYLFEVLIREGEKDLDRLAKARADAESYIRLRYGASVDIKYAHGISNERQQIHFGWVRATFQAP